MSTIIAVTGKGGTGKTTIAALIIRALLDKRAGLILGVDADPNSTLADAIGLKVEDTISSICEELLEKKETLPAGMTKDRFLEYKIQQSLIEKDNLSLLTMGRPEGAGCYCFVNNLLKGMIKNLTDDYDFTVADNEAGMEHLSRKTMRKIDVLFVVSDFSIIGVRSALRIYELAMSMNIKLGKSFLIVNKLTPRGVFSSYKGVILNEAKDLYRSFSPSGFRMRGRETPQPLNKLKDTVAPLDKEIQDSGLTLAGIVPFDLEIEKFSLNGQSIFDLPEGSESLKRIGEIIDKAIR